MRAPLATTRFFAGRFEMVPGSGEMVYVIPRREAPVGQRVIIIGNARLFGFAALMWWAHDTSRAN